MAELAEDDVALLVDIDCFPLNRDIVERAFAAAREGRIFGCAQSTNHIDPDRLFVAPMFMAISRRTWDRLGRPSFRRDARNDVAQALHDSGGRGGGRDRDALPMGVRRAEMAARRRRALRDRHLLSRRRLPSVRIRDERSTRSFFSRSPRRRSQDGKSISLALADRALPLSLRDQLGEPRSNAGARDLVSRGCGAFAAERLRRTRPRRTDPPLSRDDPGLCHQPRAQPRTARLDGAPARARRASPRNSSPPSTGGAAGARRGRRRASAPVERRDGADPQPPQGVAALLASPAAVAAVLEDDVRLGARLRRDPGARLAEPAFELVKLETLFDMVWLRAPGKRWARVACTAPRRAPGAAAYLISRAGALKMLAPRAAYASPST